MGLRTAADTVATSLIQSPAASTTAVGSMLAGTITGSTVVQVLAGIASLFIIIKTAQDILINARKLKDEKKEDP